jgi:hypothetical protein
MTVVSIVGVLRGCMVITSNAAESARITPDVINRIALTRFDMRQQV